MDGGNDALSESQVRDLLERQDRLQEESRRVLIDLDLMAVLSTAGQPVQVGSSVFGLMVWRDIDIHVYFKTGLLDAEPTGSKPALEHALSPDLAFETMRPLASHPRISSFATLIGAGRLPSRCCQTATIGAYTIARTRVTRGKSTYGFSAPMRRVPSRR